LYKNKKIAALIFLREDSSRVQNKNLRDFHGKPLFHVILETLKNSQYIDQIIVNTPSQKIIDGCNDLNVKTHRRPDWLDAVNTNEANAIIDYDLSLLPFDYYIQTHSTNPLLTEKTIDKSIQIFFENMDSHDSLFTVTPFKKRFYKSDFSSINHNHDSLKPTQEIEPVLMENSCIYIFSKKSFLNKKNRIGSKPYVYEMNFFESIDIDTEEDFKLAKIAKDLV
jgi:CMP-N-acetylneuraminic acid synthetase